MHTCTQDRYTNTHSTLHIHTQLALLGPLLETGTVKVFPIHTCAFICYSVMHTCTHTGTPFHVLVNFCTHAAGSLRLPSVRPSEKTKRVQGLPYLLLTRLSYIQIPCTPIKCTQYLFSMCTSICSWFFSAGSCSSVQKNKTCSRSPLSFAHASVLHSNSLYSH